MPVCSASVGTTNAGACAAGVWGTGVWDADVFNRTLIVLVLNGRAFVDAVAGLPGRRERGGSVGSFAVQSQVALSLQSATIGWALEGVPFAVGIVVFQGASMGAL